jgi:glycosyltransferase involved in cell wall biosynthesis
LLPQIYLDVKGKIPVMKSLRIGVATVPIGKSGIPPLSNLMEMLSTYSENLYLYTGNDGFTYFKSDPRFHVEGRVYSAKRKSLLVRFFHYLWIQIITTRQIVSRKNDVDIWIFFFGGYRLHLPLITAKLLKKQVILLLADSGGRHTKSSDDIRSRLPKIFRNFPYEHADKIIIYSPRLITDFHLESYCHKIHIAQEHFLDFNTFTVTTPFSKRPLLIGYIGRFSEEKGILQLVKALPAILDNQKDLRIFIGGDGPLRESVKTSVEELKNTDRVDIPGWIDHNNLSLYLNQIRLLIIPSNTESGPITLLEAMACGTPVLATRVGMIPDIIKDGETGFILGNNSSECVVENVQRALSSPDLERIAEAGRRLVVENYTFDSAVTRWKSILDEIA